MEILITGDLRTFASTLAVELLDDGHRIVVSDHFHAMRKIKNKNFTSYEMSHIDALFGEIFHAHSFDTVIHIAPQSNTVLDRRALEERSTSGELEKTLSLSVETGVEKFLLISSLDIYGDAANVLEDTLPQPNTSYGQVLLNAENLCLYYAKNHRLSASIIRVPNIYGPPESYSILTNLIHQSWIKTSVELDVSRHDQCNFLHIQDLISLIHKIIDQTNDCDSCVFNLTEHDINFDFLTQQLNLYFPKVKYQFLETISKAPLIKKFELINASSTFG